MNKSMILSLALGTALLAGPGGAIAASVEHDSRYHSSNTRHDRDGSWRDRDVRGQDFTGVWRLDGRRGDANGGWNDGRRGRNDNFRHGTAAYLPDVFQIERARRELRVENQNGRLIRRIEMGRRGDWNGNRLEVESVVRGARVTEYFSLQRGGRELIVRTIVDGPRGNRQFTSVYERA